MKNFIAISCILIASIGSHASNIIEENGCSTKLKQVMRPEYPAARISGYAQVKFDIKENGEVENISSHKSMCLRHNRKEDTYSFKRCGIFITNSIAATYYMEFKPPVDEGGNACSIKNKKHLYRFMSVRNDKVIHAFEKEFLEEPSI